MNTTNWLAMISQRAYRSIAIELVHLERIRAVVSVEALGSEPEGTILGSPELELEYSMSPRSGCSVYGFYQYRAGRPAIIVVHPSLAEDRDNFTLVHEYGHHVQRHHEPWADALYALTPADRAKVEERVADAFAAEVLIPAAETFESRWLSASFLAQVHEGVRASRSAVAMRAIEIAPSTDSATVVVCDSEGVVIFARSLGDDVFAPARGVAQPGLANLFSAAANSDGHASGPLVGGLRAGSNWIQEDVQVDLALDHSGFFAFAILRPTQRFGRVQEWTQDEVECANGACELVFTVDASILICPTCGDPKCPACRSCSCELAAAPTCPECWVELSVAEQNGTLQHECL